MDGPRFNEDLLKVPLYIAGKSVEEVKEALGLDEVIKLASNESPVGPSPRAVAAAQAMLSQAHRYPGVCQRELRRKLAAMLGAGLSEANIVLGNGGTDVLRMITQAFIFDSGNTVMSRATFPMYHILTTTFGGTPRQVDLTPDYQHDFAALMEQINSDTRLVFLCSPNNPTGKIITQDEADSFMARVPPHVVVVFDESYCDYVTEPGYANSLRYVEQSLNVLTVRSFSKSAGLANLRVGYLVGPARLADYVRHAGLPFHSGDIALAAAAASLDDVEFQARNVQAVVEGRQALRRALQALGLRTLPSQANFVTIVDPPLGADGLAEALLRRGIIVRAMGSFGMPDAIRVTVGTPTENERFIATLQAILEEAP